MLSQKQLSVLKPFFSRHESQLQQLKNSSISPYITHISITDEKQLFYSWGQRRIFHDVKLKEKQIKAINQVKTLIIEEEKFLVNQFSDQIILRHIHSCGLDSKAAYQRLKKLYSILNPKPNQVSFLKYLQKQNFQNIENQLKKGVIYTSGKSSQNSFPLIILQVSKLNTDLSVEQNFAIFYLMICLVIQYRMKPHWQEKYMFLIDLEGLSVSQIPYKYMYKFMETIGILFAGMCQKILVYNSQKIGMLWQIVKRILPDHTVGKVLFVDQTNVKNVLQIINPHQLQQKYGGNIKDIKQYWPPKPIRQSYVPSNISNNVSIFKQLEQSSIQEDNTTQYYSFKSIQMMQSVKIQKTYKSLGITKKKLIPQENQPEEEYEIEKQEFFDKLNIFCGIKNKNDSKSQFCKFF